MKSVSLITLGIFIGWGTAVAALGSYTVSQVNTPPEPLTAPQNASAAAVPSGWSDYQEYDLSVAQYPDGSVYVVAKGDYSRVTFADYLTEGEKAAFGLACLERWARKTFGGAVEAPEVE